MLTSTIDRVRALLFINMGVAIVAAPFVSWSLWMVALIAVMFTVYNNMGLVIYNHRYLTHGSFKFKHKAVELFFWFCALISGSGSPAGWASLHRLHHQHCDTPRDPHWAKRGWFKTIFLYYEATKRDLMKAAIPFAKDAKQRFAARYWVALIAAWALALLALGLDALYFGFCVPSALAMLAQGATNYFNHKVGYRNYDSPDDTTNLWPMAILNWGDGFHNNHHTNPSNSTSGEKRWEIDIGGYVIDAVKVKV